MSVPTAANRVFWGVNTTYTLSGVTYVSVSNIRFRWGYAVHEELVTGTTDPYLGTGGFHGEIDVEGLGASDMRWEDAASVVSGVLPTFGMTWREGDTQGIISGNRTWTASGKFSNYEKVSERDNVVRYSLRGILALEPTVVQS